MTTLILGSEGGYQEFTLNAGEWAWLIFAAVVALVAIAVGFVLVQGVLAADQGTPKMREIAGMIQEGAMAYLKRQFRTIAFIIIPVAALVFLTSTEVTKPDGIVALTFGQSGLFRTLAFIAGAFLSGLTGFIGMSLAVRGNVRTAAAAKRGSLPDALKVAFRTGGVAGMYTVGLGLLGATIIIMLFQNTSSAILIGFGFGGSLIALFMRVGGGIFTKAADVGADLVGKIEKNIPEDDPRNPATIADNVGDNVGDIAGMGADLFGSCAEATCAALVIGATAAGIAENETARLYPILITAVGIPVCLITALLARIKDNATSVEPVLKRQLLLSTILMTVAIIGVTNVAMVDSFTLGSMIVTRNGVLTSVLAGLWSGLLIGYITEYYTSHSYGPVRRVADASRTGAATNIIYGLSLGYESAVIPVLALAVTTYFSWTLAGMYGIALAAIGMISTIAIGLTIDAYGPVSDNAGGIAEMAHLGPEIRKRTDILDAAGNTTAAIGKGFAIGSAVLTALALFAAFLTRSGIDSLNLLSPKVFAGLLVGGVLPFLFTAQTMLAVGTAAFGMIEEVRRQFKTIPGLLEGTAKPDYKRCVAISTNAALRQMIPPAILVLGSPLLFGVLFGIEALAGMLAGSLVTGVVMALSASNSGGGWDNAKKYIESGAHGGKGSDTHKAAVVGDTVGDPFKDTSGPSLNILMKLMAILSLVFAPFIKSAHDTLVMWLGM